MATARTAVVIQAYRRQRMEAKAAGQDVVVPWTLFELRREWNQAKHQIAPWWAQNSTEAYSSGLDGLARAFRNWQEAKQGRRAGPRMVSLNASGRAAEREAGARSEGLGETGTADRQRPAA